ncbi:hypothetical protein TNIN_477881 [Trichonephila inaurata madagascariensis]|uniref:Uncharacterized protein n=1 Tax=Trichonephila inaurata madagascariensis TaxID=2747483 RepID=A0A8X7C274_9ARAC|nr:hypothetical protein TNIN_477881 [Trichonephila inaurata madagascariensis]
MKQFPLGDGTIVPIARVTRPGGEKFDKNGSRWEKRGFSFMFISLLQWRGSFTERNEGLTISERKCLLGNTSSWKPTIDFLFFFRQPLMNNHYKLDSDHGFQ